MVIMKMKSSIILVEKSLSYLDGHVCPTLIILFSTLNSFQCITIENGVLDDNRNL